MAFGIGANGNILEDFTNSVQEAFGSAGAGNNSLTNKGPLSFKSDPTIDPSGSLFGISPILNKDRWAGNSNRARAAWLRYGFAIIDATSGKFEVFEDPYFLDIPPQSINQKEIFSTSVQATRKGVNVESEGVVFKDIVISGTTGIFPGERAGSNTPSPNSIGSFTEPPSPPSGVDATTGRSKTNGVATLSGYEEFLRLRQFFLLYAQKKVDSKGNFFFAFLNEKDGQQMICEPLEFTMERNARNPLNYNYRIVLKAIAPLESLFNSRGGESAAGILNQLINVAANVSATLASATEVINASTNLLVGITQALDNIFLTPMRQLNLALKAMETGASRVITLPGTLSGNAERVDKNRLAIAENIGNITTKALGNRQTGSTAAAAEFNDQGSVIDTSALDNTSEELNLLNPDGSLKEEFTPQEFSAAKNIENQIENDTNVPVPRSFVEDLKANTQAIINNLADSVGLGSDSYSDILGRTVTQLAPPLATPSDEQFLLLGTMQTIVSELNKILSNNGFFQADAEQIYDAAQNSYGVIADIRQPDFGREITIEVGDTLERIALREYGDALRWVDIVILNNLKAPYISEGEDLPTGVKKAGDKILVGNV